MSKIDRVYIATHRADLRLTRICVASVRRWYPSIPIFLLKDEANGRFSTQEIEERWNVEVWPVAEHAFGWGFIKLEPLFDKTPLRYLVLDSDIVFVGRVIEALEQFDHDFVVQLEEQPAVALPSLYFDSARLRESLDPGFQGPLFTFNTGQYVATTGLLGRNDFANLVEWSTPRRVRHPEIFNPSDQGVLNYVLLKRLADRAITVARTPFMKWGEVEMAEFDVAALGAASPYPYLIHWAGLKKRRLRRMLRADILQHFELAYYERISLGAIRRWARIIGDDANRWIKRVSRVFASVRFS